MSLDRNVTDGSTKDLFSESQAPGEAEVARLASLRRHEILDTSPDAAFDRVAAMARRWFKTPIALVSFVDEDRIWFKAGEGVELQEIPREPGFCSTVVTDDADVYEVRDAREDPRTRANSLVTGDFGLRFYAAAPIEIQGYRLGTVCVVDHEPRALDDEDRAVLRDLASIVVDEMQLRMVLRDRARLLLHRAEEVRRTSLGRVALGLTHDLTNRLQGATTLLEEVAASDGLDPRVADSMREVLRRLAETAKLCTPIAELGATELGGRGDPVAAVPRLQRILPLLEASAEGRVRERELRSERSVAILPYDLDLVVEIVYRHALLQSPRGAPIRVSCSDAMHPSGDPLGVVIEVTHPGPMRDRSILDHLSDPLHGALASEPGLELPVVGSLLRSHGGSLRVRSNADRTVWSIWLPSSEDTPPTVVVVEDDELVRGALTRALRKDYEVIAFADAREVLSWPQIDRVQALVTDHNLPEMSGVELARELRKRDPSLPVMIVTGYRLEGALDAGFAFLRKPFSMDELRQWLAEAMSARHRRSA